jgi:hypothetical protein
MELVSLVEGWSYKVFEYVNLKGNEEQLILYIYFVICDLILISFESFPLHLTKHKQQIILLRFLYKAQFPCRKGKGAAFGSATECLHRLS